MFELAYKYDIPGEVIGSVVTLWSEVSSAETLGQRVWLRSAAMAERTWNGNTYYSGDNRSSVLGRINAQGKRMRARGVKVAPVSTGLCEAKGIF
jgi:hypothetical protein